MRSLLFIALLLPNLVFAQDIQFKNLTIQDALKQAKQENKDVFISVYTTFCESCHYMNDHVFNDKKVGNYYNQNYISIGIDAETEEGKALVEEYNLHIYPSYLYFNNENTPLHLLVGNMDTDVFLKSSKEARDPEHQLYTVKKKVNKQSSLEYIANYIYLTYKAANEDPEMLAVFLSKLKDENIEEDKVWLGLKEATIHLGLESEALLYVAKHAMQIEKEHGVKEIIQTVNASARISMRPYVLERNISGWEDLMAHLEKELGRVGETLNYAYNPAFYFSINDYSTAYSKMEKGVQVLSDRDPEVRAYLYRNWAWNVYHYFNEKEKIDQGLVWINAAIEVHPTCMNLETKSGLLFKNKDYKQAKIYAEKAIELEKKEDVHAMLAHTILRELENLE